MAQRKQAPKTNDVDEKPEPVKDKIIQLSPDDCETLLSLADHGLKALGFGIPQPGLSTYEVGGKVLRICHEQTR